jgi:hypothetical protein
MVGLGSEKRKRRLKREEKKKKIVFGSKNGPFF